MEEIRFNLAAPDLLCICVDDRQHGENSGRLVLLLFQGSNVFCP